mmetsp:Transcript_124337/g.247921  ORF Transcript_124337/g.247921 Transcript_124337/m.247921 type:complete len:466 (-) Transcript_124337:23-1420(-)
MLQHFKTPMVFGRVAVRLQAQHSRRARSLILTSAILAGVVCLINVTSSCFAVSALKEKDVQRPYVVGDDVKARSPDDNRWYPGTVVEAHPDGKLRVKWDDPVEGPESNDVEVKYIRKVTIFMAYKVDDFVHAVDPDDGNMYPGTVVQDNRDGTFQIRWEDPDGGPEECAVTPKNMRYPPIALDTLKVGQKHRGTVKGIHKDYAFVDIGAVKPGFLHISMVSRRRITSIHNVLEENQDLDVWISKLEPGRFRLTAVGSLLPVDSSIAKPIARRSTWTDLAPFARTSSEDWFEGTVVSLQSFGAFVRVELPTGEEAEGLVHISQLSDGFVEDVSSKVEMGQKVMVRITKVDTTANRIQLSMKAGLNGVIPTNTPKTDHNFRPFASVPPDQWLTGKVSQLVDYGAFVSVNAPGREKVTGKGLVHITRIKNEFVEKVEDEFKVGQQVRVRILEVDVEEARMFLTTKPID